eukprot:08348.XXX_231475_229406_1 [CDS] Oithona nana genome sequencing.
MDTFQTIQSIGTDKHPKGSNKDIQYGTAGFRTKAAVLEHVMYRMGALAAIRSKAKGGSAIGVMITASHNPPPDNGVKLVDPAGEMLEAAWESIATTIANASDENLGQVLENIVVEHQIPMDAKSVVFVGRDTRTSSQALSKAVTDGVEAVQGAGVVDYGVVSTPQLHYFVVCHNTKGAYGQASIEGYFEKLSKAFVDFRQGQKLTGNYKNTVVFDGANGVGAIAMSGLLKSINSIQEGFIKVEMYNGQVESGDLLNSNCGADFVKVGQRAPENIVAEKMKRCVSVDGDADRVVFYYNDDQGHFRLLDGDRIATLIAGYIKDLLSESGLDLNLGLVQTAYANGGSTDYITSKLDVPVACVPTGVKHLHHKALDFDIGVYFEANGHGTVLYSDQAQAKIQNATNCAGKKLRLFMDMTNQCVGDALSDMLLVESVLFAKGWNAHDWFSAYQDLPNRLMKVLVKDRNVVQTTDAERKCVKPDGLQEAINETVSKFPKGRSFVRPSGTEDVVRVYAEANTRDNADQLAHDVGLLVHSIGGGVGEPPSKPQ